MVREFKFFRGYKEETLTERWGGNPITIPGTGTINWGTTSSSATWVINPYQTYLYTPLNHTTITTTPDYSAFTFPYGSVTTGTGTSTGFCLTTSNPNGTTYTTEETKQT